MTVKESPIVTPTFAAVLNKNLLRITDYFSEGDLFGAYYSLKTTVGLLKKAHRKELEEELLEIKKQISKAMRRHHIDLALARQSKYKGVVQVLRQKLFDLFLKLMDVLHEYGYLEKQRRRVLRSDFEELENGAETEMG